MQETETQEVINQVEIIKKNINWKAYFIFFGLLLLYWLGLSLINRFNIKPIIFYWLIELFWAFFMAIVIYALFMKKK